MQFGNLLWFSLKGISFSMLLTFIDVGRSYFIHLGDLQTMHSSYHSLTYTLVLCHSLIMCVHAPTCTRVGL